MKSITYFMKIIFMFMVLWLILLGLMSIIPDMSLTGSSKLNSVEDFSLPSLYKNNDAAELSMRMDKALQEIIQLKKNNYEMRKLLSGGSIKEENEVENLTRDEVVVNEDGLAGKPSSIYEKTRRLLEIDLKEIWYSIRAKRDNIGESEMEDIENIYKQLRAHILKLRFSDGYESSRNKETVELSNLIQKRIYDLQNPTNCDSARKLVCTLNKGCGFGCQIHHVGYCLIVAYATSRTLILESKGWRYNRQGWEKVFLPLSNTCTKPNGATKGDWSSGKHNVQVLQLPIVDFIKPRPPYLPVSIPSDIGDKIERIHGEPHIWWIGQFMKYLLRLQPPTNTSIEESKAKLGFSSPIVGIHIRRTDKIGTEASFHSLKEYMDHADDYFDIIDNFEGSRVKRKVFIASDDPSVLTEAINSYPAPEWEILGDKGVAQSASLAQRYFALHGIIKDVFLLSECDFVICTFSSQVCRLAYEIMQTRRADASQKFISLDDVYYYGGGIGVVKIAEKSHEARNDQEIDLKPGDIIGLAGNHWNGFSKGTNRRTNKMGLFPSYKVRDSQQLIDFPAKKWWGWKS